MAYAAWSVVFGEQPTAAKWNQLGTNDAGFKDGTNIDDEAILNRHIAVGAITPDLFVAGGDTDWEWDSWTPTITTDTGAVSAVVVNVARYKRIGRKVDYYLDVSFTIGGASAARSIFFTLPSSTNLIAANQPIGAGFHDGVTTWAQMNGVGNQVICRRYDNAVGAFSVGAGKVLRQFGTYEVA